MKIEAEVWVAEGCNQRNGIRQVSQCYFLINNDLSVIVQKVAVVQKVTPFRYDQEERLKGTRNNPVGRVNERS